jgi:hypothetical protein
MNITEEGRGGGLREAEGWPLECEGQYNSDNI